MSSSNNISETDIQNVALIKMGATPIASGGATSNAGIAVQQIYPIARDALLRSYAWPFAKAFAALNQLAATPIGLDFLPQDSNPGSVIFSVSYALPNDFLRMLRFSPRQAHWRLVGQTLYTDAVPVPQNLSLNGLQPAGGDTAVENQPPTPTNVGVFSPTGFEYLQRVTDTNRMDSLFVEVLAVKIAYECAFAVSGLESLQDRLAKEWEMKQMDARAVAGFENWPDQLYEHTVVDARYGYSGINIDDLSSG